MMAWAKRYREEEGISSVSGDCVGFWDSKKCEEEREKKRRRRGGEERSSSSCCRSLGSSGVGGVLGFALDDEVVRRVQDVRVGFAFDRRLAVALFGVL